MGLGMFLNRNTVWTGTKFFKSHIKPLSIQDPTQRHYSNSPTKILLIRLIKFVGIHLDYILAFNCIAYTLAIKTSVCITLNKQLLI